MSSVQISQLENDCVLFTLDMPGKSANVLTDQVYDDLDAALKQVEAKPPRGIILYSAKPSIFVAGADLGKISSNYDWPDEKIFEFCDHGRSIMSRFSELPNTVSVAAIHGVCVGGGLELPLWCDHRIASDNRRTLLGLPEVKLGLIPGWAGTVRLPRLIGLQAAVQLVASGDLIDSQKSLELGLITRVVPEEELLTAAQQIINDEHETKNFQQQRQNIRNPVSKLPKNLEQFENETRQAIADNTQIDPSAPTIVLEHMIATHDVDQDAACQGESVAFAKVWGSEENRGLLHSFFLDERAKKVRADFGEANQPVIKQVGIVGAGLMGSQIARLASAAGFELKIYDANEAKMNELVANVNENPQTAGSATSVADLTEFANCELVIESIVEKPVIKKQLFERLCKIVSPDTFLATNTSTIPVAEIATAVTNPKRLVGLHFCCPVEPLKLVEVIRGPETSGTAVNVAIEWIRKFRKTPIVVNDCPGFIVNRLLCPVFDQAMVMLQFGIDMQRIDRVFRDFGFAAGPLEMIDFIGVDTIMYAGETFLRAFPELVNPTPILPALVKRGRLGRKTKLGFYQYESVDSPALPDDEFQKINQSYQKSPEPSLVGMGPSLSDEQILMILLRPMAKEAKRILDDGVVDDSRDIDICSILGTTFPRVHGGIMHWAQKNQL